MEKVAALRQLDMLMEHMGLKCNYALTGSLALNLLGFQLHDGQTAGDIDVAVFIEPDKVEEVRKHLETLSAVSGMEIPNPMYKNPPIRFNLTYKTEGGATESIIVDAFIGTHLNVLERNRIYVKDERDLVTVPVMGVIYNLRQKFHLNRPKDQIYKNAVMALIANMA